MADGVKKIKWKRTRAPKVRTGCLTWIRHLKCDEGKPTCQRCEKDKRVCDGYTNASDSKQKQKPIIVHQKQKLLPQRLLTTPRLLFPAPPVSEALKSSTEFHLFHHFRTYTVSELAGSLNAMDFWHTYALPLSHSSKTVKAAVCALGSAHKSFKLQSQAGPTTQSLARSYEIISVQQYNNAIKVIHEHIGSLKRNFQEIMTCCLMFICIESLYGRYINVTRHLEAAFSLLNTHGQWNDRGTVRLNAIGARGKQDDLLKFIETICPSLCGLASDLFIYLGDNAPPKLLLELEKWVKAHDPGDLEDSHTPFTSAQAAASSLSHIESIFSVELYAGWSSCGIEEICCDDVDPVMKRGSEESVSKRLYHNWNARFKAYKRAFDPSKASESELYRFKLLELYQASWDAAVKLESIYDDWETTDCANILQTAESVIQYLNTGRGQDFTFQASIVPQIAFVIIACEETSIQWKGVQLLRSFGRKEGIWDSIKMADIYASMITAKTNKLLARDDIPCDVPQLIELLSSLRLSTTPCDTWSLVVIDDS